MDELSEGDKLTVSRARKIQKFLSQPFQVAEVFTGHEGKIVPLKDTIDGFKRLVNGEFDDIPELAFYMVGNVEDVIEKSKKMVMSTEPLTTRSNIPKEEFKDKTFEDKDTQKTTDSNATGKINEIEKQEDDSSICSSTDNDKDSFKKYK